MSRRLLVIALSVAGLILLNPGRSLPATPSTILTPAATAAADAWPHVLHEPEGDVTVYQPQAEAWPDRAVLTARAAVSITPKSGEPILGTIEISLSTDVDQGAGVVHLSDPKLVSSHFPSLDTGRASALQDRINQLLPQMRTREVPLASVLLSLDQTLAPQPTLNNDPPRIFVADRPASLVVFDGPPVLAPVGAAGLEVAVNTNWQVFHADGGWFLLNNGLWMTAPEATGLYSPTTKLPAAFQSLPDDPSLADARRAIPARLPNPSVPIPFVFVSTVPADIIVTDGRPRFARIAGTSLQRVSNTASTLVFDTTGKLYYLLLAGRWFAASQLWGPWHFATESLPPDFAELAADQADKAVLASVPGTEAAETATVKAQIPTTVTLKRTTPPSITVIYTGPPRYVPIPGTSITAAVNTHSIVLNVAGRYYVCENGVWFVGATPTGPWMLADTLPAEIKTIPPTSAYFNVTYAHVYRATPEAITYGYTAGYVMGYVTAGVLVYGTGYVYPPVIIPGPVPVYYPRPYTYAGNVWYNTATGAWVRGGSVSGPYYGASAVHGYNPSTGAWGVGGSVYGPYGGAGAWSYYNPSNGSYARGTASWSNGSGVANASFYNAHTGVSGTTNQNWNPYGRWGSSTFSGPQQTVNTRSAANANGSAGGFSSSTGAKGAGYYNRNTGVGGGAVKTQNNNVYAGRDGNVYKNTGDGWQKWDNGGWSPVTPPSKTTRTARPQTTSNANPATLENTARGGSLNDRGWQQLQQDRLGRQFGQERTGGARTGRSSRGRYQRQ